MSPRTANHGTESQIGQGKVAIYWDFENLHAVLWDKENGEGAYRDSRFSVQPALIQLAPVIDYAASFGDVIINRAYGNWQWFHRYRDELNGAGIDLIQLFPRGSNMKNSADIRMALDALSDIHTHPHLTHVVVVSSDSDFISLAQKSKQAGKFIAGVGVNGVSNKFWVSSCNEFKFYEGLLAFSEAVRTKAQKKVGGTPDQEKSAGSMMEEARNALITAMAQLVAKTGENYVARSGLKLVIKRLMPSFDETILGCANFSGFLSRFPDIVTAVDEVSGGHVALINGVPSTESTPPESPRDVPTAP